MYVVDIGDELFVWFFFYSWQKFETTKMNKTSAVTMEEK